MKKVNLDAMILREDFSIDSGYTATNRFKQINISDLKFDSVFRHTIRKPDYHKRNRPDSYYSIHQKNFGQVLLSGYPQITYNNGKYRGA